MVMWLLARGGSDARTIGQACRRGAAGHRATMRALRRLRLHTRAKRQRQKARSEILVENDAARAAKSGAIAGQVRAEAGCFLSGKRTWPGRVRLGVLGRAWQPKCKRTSGNEDCEPARKVDRTFTIGDG